jgi:hypothetical protein
VPAIFTCDEVGGGHHEVCQWRPRGGNAQDSQTGARSRHRYTFVLSYPPVATTCPRRGRFVREVARCLDWPHGVHACQAWQSLRTTVWHESCHSGSQVSRSRHLAAPLSTTVRAPRVWGESPSTCRGSCPRMGDSLDAERPCRGTPRCRHGPQEGAWDVWRRRPLYTVRGGTSPAAVCWCSVRRPTPPPRGGAGALQRKDGSQSHGDRRRSLMHGTITSYHPRKV